MSKDDGKGTTDEAPARVLKGGIHVTARGDHLQAGVTPYNGPSDTDQKTCRQASEL